MGEVIGMRGRSQELGDAEKVRKVWDCGEGWDVVDGKGKNTSPMWGKEAEPGKR